MRYRSPFVERLLVLFLILSGCSAKTSGDKIENLPAIHSVELHGFVTNRDPFSFREIYMTPNENSQTMTFESSNLDVDRNPAFPTTEIESLSLEPRADVASPILFTEIKRRICGGSISVSRALPGLAAHSKKKPKKLERLSISIILNPKVTSFLLQEPAHDQSKSLALILNNRILAVLENVANKQISGEFQLTPTLTASSNEETEKLFQEIVEAIEKGNSCRKTKTK